MEVRPQERRYGDTGLLMLLDRAGMPLLLCVGAQEIQERDDDLRDIAAYMKQQVVRGGRAEEQSKRKEGGSWPLHAVRRGQGFCRQREASLLPYTAEAWAGRVVTLRAALARLWCMLDPSIRPIRTTCATSSSTSARTGRRRTAYLLSWLAHPQVTHTSRSSIV